MVISWEVFAIPSISSNKLNKDNIQTVNTNPDILWGVLEWESVDQDSEELINLTKSKSMTQHKILKKSSKYKDPNLGQPNGLLWSTNIEVTCE